MNVMNGFPFVIVWFHLILFIPSCLLVSRSISFSSFIPFSSTHNFLLLLSHHHHPHLVYGYDIITTRNNTESTSTPSIRTSIRRYHAISNKTTTNILLSFIIEATATPPSPRPSSFVTLFPPNFYGKNTNYQSSRNLGVIVGLLSLLTLSWICYNMYTRRKLTQKREKLFEQNGGVLLKQQLAQSSGAMETSKIYSTDELKTATKNYREDRVLGKGGYGTVYKGIIRNGFEVAIKKSKVADQTQVEQFINEVVILTQINHRNVVKLLGCCLETEVPLLVYEYISNGTLFEHIHRNKGITSWLTWASCIRIASEVADALMYLHSAASIPIIHRDVKSTNILLDESYTAKISDFGASRLVPIDQTQVTTLVQGTLGYLDPEYFHTSQLTEKSDVYSFGIVLAELLTREKPLCIERTIEERNLATYFVLAMKEDRLMEIVDPQLVREASEEQLLKVGKLIKECLNIRGEERPSMKEVALELEGLKKQNRHPWAAQNNEDTSDLMGEHDLYPSPLNGHQGSASTTGFSGQYSMEISLISEMNHPR